MVPPQLLTILYDRQRRRRTTIVYLDIQYRPRIDWFIGINTFITTHTLFTHTHFTAYSTSAFTVTSTFCFPQQLEYDIKRRFETTFEGVYTPPPTLHSAAQQSPLDERLKLVLNCKVSNINLHITHNQSTHHP
jgi:hypothetical protein